jgi:putative FmdB family regulatory protein
MPIYEYRCAECGHQEEHLQKLSDAPLIECPSCHKPALKKMLSAAGFQLKGSGWYATDFKSSGKKPAEKSAESRAEAKTESKTESKAEPTTGPKSEPKAEPKAEPKKEAAPADTSN